MPSSDATFRFASPHRPAVLIIDDDVTSLSLLERGLTRLYGYDVKTAASACEGLGLVQTMRFDLLLIDLRLPDMSGIGLVRKLTDERRLIPFILVTGFADVPTTVEAMQLGAFTVLEKPVSIEDLGDVTERALSRTRRGAPPASAQLRQSSVERLASHIVSACSSGRDLKTLRDWARFEGLSYTTLCETCRLAGVRPHDARDFTRVLRCVVRARVYRCSMELLLDIGDHRTLEVLLRKAGLKKELDCKPSIEQYLQLQQFVSVEHVVLEIVKSFLGCQGLVKGSRTR